MKGKYVILSTITSRVFKARDLESGRLVVLKGIKPQDVAEASVLSQLHSLHIVPFLGVTEVENTPYLVFSFVEGRTITDYLLERGSIDFKTSVEWLTCVALALTHFHAKGIIHRDLKPLNIMIHKDNYALVLDFSIALHKYQVKYEVGVGSPFYMAPEQHKGKPSLQSDIFAFGVTAYEMLSGTHPFSGDLYSLKMARKFKPLSRQVPEDLRAIVAHCLTPTPKLRPDAEFLVRRLRQV